MRLPNSPPILLLLPLFITTLSGPTTTAMNYYSPTPEINHNLYWLMMEQQRREQMRREMERQQ